MNGDAPARGVNVTDLIAGLALVAFCGFFVALAWGYGIGRPARMGPGFYPFAFGLIGAALGLAITWRALFSTSRAEATIFWRPLLFVCAGVSVFGLTIAPFGLGPAVFASTIVTAYADRDQRPLGSVVLAVFLAVATWLIFVKLLGLPIPFVDRPR